ncbi:hypothetical protein [Profundibacter sp.]
MTRTSARTLPDTPFWKAYQGRFFGLLAWAEVDAFWASMSGTTGDWFVFDPEQPAPDRVASAADLANVLTKAQALINSRRDMSHCGAIYVDDARNPTFIKVFDPSAMGSSCNISGIPILPRWIISRIRPDDMPPPPEPVKPSLFKRLTGRS